MSDLAPGDTIWVIDEPAIVVVKSVHLDTTPPALSYAARKGGEASVRQAPNGPWLQTTVDTFWLRYEDEGVRWCRDAAAVDAMLAADALAGPDTEPFFFVMGPYDAPDVPGGPPTEDINAMMRNIGDDE